MDYGISSLEEVADKIVGTSLEDIESIRKELENNLEFTSYNVIKRNILIVGKSGSGKSTAIETLRDPFHVAGFSTMISTTVNANLNDVLIKSSGGSYALFTLVDTPGLAETKEDDTARDDNTLISVIGDALKKNLTTIDCLLLFIDSNVMLDERQILIIETIITNFCSHDLKTIVCLTKSEKLAVKQIKDNMDKLYKRFQSKYSHIIDNLSFKPLGCVDQNLLETNSKETVRDTYKKIISMRRMIINEMMKSECGINLAVLPITSSKQADAIKLFDLCISKMDNIINSIGSNINYDFLEETKQLHVIELELSLLSGFLPISNSKKYI